MEIDHDTDACAVYVQLVKRPVDHTIELLADTVLADYADDGTLLGVEILGARHA